MVALLTPPARHLRADVAVRRPAVARPTATPGTFRRRRAGASAVVAALVLAVAVLLGVAFGGHSSAVTVDTVDAGVPAASPVPGHAGAHVVQPGDTVWSIARRIQPEGDVRGLVDRIVAANGGATLTAGQRLVLDE